ncbi:MAG: methyl-accepting chemotaxis protein [Burkholderiales bacterium]|nr:type IV pili methyl-accepting chemotaxis transducer N-terminal domain-containing protein [Burkholderiales bacterium]MDQ3195670.1 methyl-accepting chemotaxis protein [Pseudomonadota bacterium]
MASILSSFRFPLFGSKGGKGRLRRTADTQDPNYDPMQTISMTDDIQKDKSSTPSQLPLIGALPHAKQLKVLGTLLLLFLALGALMIFINSRQTTHSGIYISTAREMQMLSQRLAKGAQQAVVGNVSGFDQLQDSRDTFARDLATLSQGGSRAGRDVPASSGEAQAELRTISQQWQPIEDQASLILAEKNSLLNLGKSVAAINASNTQLLELADEVASLIAQNGGAPRAIATANQLTMLTQKLAKNANALLSGETIDPEVAFLLAKDTNVFRANLQGLLNGSEELRLSPVSAPEARDRLGALQALFKEFEGSVNSILQNMQKLISTKQAGQNIYVGSEQLMQDTQDLTQVYEKEFSEIATTVATIVFGVLAFATMLLIGKVILHDARRRSLDSGRENQRNQEAILRLLNELGDLADGDLTVQALVTEDITGAIADSINLTIEELRTLVNGINKATGQVASASSKAQTISRQLIDATAKQSVEIKETTSSVLQMAQSITEVSASAAESANVAKRSLNAAEKGTIAVQNTISGMNEIREQIQETAKRIKRLGESSQEIGEIVELISDITEQTNVLALNAAIQAASAGEAGRGFTVVAEEVQRLAERSGEATKQIGAIVKTIQTDTQDAVAAMEKSTHGVVEGAKLSDAAGQTLQEIGEVSKNLAQLATSISTATQAQAESTDKVAKNMQEILRITDQTTQGTQQTAVSIGQLADLATELKGSVSGFKLG